MYTITNLFDSSKDTITNLLNSIEKCAIQLPDFQRGWVWDDERIRKLLVSIAKSYPIGAVMLFETGGNNVDFYNRPVEGVINTENKTPSSLILDGQQRLTSLFQALKLKKPVKTRDSKGNEVERLYYIKIDDILGLSQDQDDCVVSVPGDKIIRGFGRNVILKDYTKIENECADGLFPLNLLFDFQGASVWWQAYTQNGTNTENLKKNYEFSPFLMNLAQYMIPVITLSKSTTKEAVCSVFENVNTGGVSLSVFELLTAMYAADGFRLRDDWERKEDTLKNTGELYCEVLQDITTVEFLQALSLVSTFKLNKAVSCKRKDILELPRHEYTKWSDKIVKAMIETAKFLQEQYIFDTRDLPYGSQIVPLTAIFLELESELKIHANRLKLARWYWCGVFGELYGGANETRFARDYVEVANWIRNSNSSEPQTILDSNFSSQRFLTLKTRNSAAYKGLYVCLLKNGAMDFISGQELNALNFYNMKIDIHHIFPKSYCEKVGIDKDRKDSIVNKAPLSSETNKSIGGRKPSEYLATLDKKNNRQITDKMLQSQKIEPSYIRADDFDSFFDARMNELILIIETETGKKVR